MSSSLRKLFVKESIVQISKKVVSFLWDRVAGLHVRQFSV